MTWRVYLFATCIFAACIVRPCDLSAQDRSSLESDVQTGFAGFDWGATLDEIRAKEGRPVQDTVLRDYHRLVYRQTIDGQPVEVWYLLHPSRGLMSGQINFQKPAAKCEDAFKRIRHDVAHANGTLKGRELKSKLNFDAICANGTSPQFASWMETWGDSGSARVSEMMLTGNPSIIVWYRSPDADAYATELFAERGPAIERFATFRWGTSRDSILARMGPAKAKDSVGGVWRLSYPDLLLGDRVLTEFTISPVEGLMTGSYWIPVPAGQNCEVFFRKFYFALIERFSGIRAQMGRVQQNPHEEFCAGVADGSASLRALWKDPKSDAFVSEQLVKPGKYVRIWYVGPPYVVWSRRTRNADITTKM